MPSPLHSRWLRPYATAVLAVGVALGLKLIAIETFGVGTPFLLFFGAVTFAAWRGGIGPGLLATALAGLVSHLFFLAPTHQFFKPEPAQVYQLAQFLAEASFISVVGSLRQRTTIEAHRRAEELRVTLSSIGDAVATTDAHGRITSLNPAAEAATGWSSAAATDRTVAEIIRLVREDTREPIECPAHCAIETGDASRFAYTMLVARDGSERSVEGSTAPIRDHDGRFLGAMLMFRDVTNRRMAEAALAEAHRKTTAVLESISDAFFALDRGWRFTYLNARALVYCDRPADTLLGQVIWDALPTDLGSAFEAEFRQAAATGRTNRFETQSTHTGQWVEITAYPSPDGLTVYFRDITERHLIGEKQSRLRDELETERALLRAVLDQMPAGVVVADARTGRVVVANAQAALPWDGRDWSEAEPAKPNGATGRGPLVGLLDRALGGEAVRGVELKRVNSGGTPAWFRVSAVPVLSRGGTVTSAVLVIDDITAEKEAEAVLRVSHAALENRVEEQGAALSRTTENLETEAAGRLAAEYARLQLVARLTTISEDERRRLSRELHDETSQFLASLIVGLKSVCCRPDVESVIGRTLETLQQHAEHISRSVHRIAWELRPAALDAVGLEAAVQSWVERWSEWAGVPAVFHSTLGPTRLPPEVETQLYRLITEALANVHKHAQANRTSVSIEQQRDTTIIAVEDDGRGFDPESVGTYGSRQGLGLLGMQERAHLLGGTLHVESSAGRGTTVLARIPYLQPREEPT